MWLKLIPSYLSMSSRTTFGEKAGTAHTLYFTVHLAGRNSLKLETGEVFQNPTLAQFAGTSRTQSTPI